MPIIRLLSLPFFISISLLLSACGVGDKGRNIDVVTIEKIKIYAKTSEYVIGDTDTLTAEVENSDGSRYNATNTVSWKSSDTDILTISNVGQLNTFKDGEVKISAILNDHLGELTVTVRPDPVTLSVYPVINVDSIIQGQTIKINAMEKQSYGSSRILEAGNGHTWSSSDEDIATIDSNGIINALGYGDIEITVSYKEFSGTAKLKILPKLKSFTLEDKEITVSTGKRAKIISKGVFVDGTEGEVNQRLTWASDDNSMLTVDNLGIVTPIRTGTTKVLVRYKNEEEVHSTTVNIRSSVYPKALNNKSITVAWNDMRAINYRLYWSKSPDIQKGDTDVYVTETPENEITISSYPTGEPLGAGENYYFRLEVIYDIDGLIGEEVAIYLPEEVAQKTVSFTRDQKYSTSHMVGTNIYFFGGKKQLSDTSTVTNKITVYRNTNQAQQRSLAADDVSRYGHASCEHKGSDGILRIYIFGGYTEQDGTTQIDNSIDIFNTYTENWDTSSPRPTMASPRAFHSCLTVGDRIYLLGGETEAGVPTNTVETFSITGEDIPLITQDLDSTLPLLNIARSHHAAISVGDKIYIAGGMTGNPDPAVLTDSVDFFDVSSSETTWTPAPALLEARKLFKLHNMNNRLYAAGGINSSDEAANTILTFDSNQWLEDTTIPDARLDVSTIAGNNAIYFLGGSLNGTASTQGQIYTINDKAWYPRRSPLQAREQYAHTRLNNEIYFFGGIIPTKETLLSTIEKYDLEQDSWEKLDVELPSPRSGAAAASLNGKIYVIGGIADKDYILKRVDIYDPQSKSWSVTQDLPVQRYGHSAVAYNNKIYVVGGIDYQFKSKPEPLNSEEDTAETTDLSMPVYVYDDSSKKWESLEISTPQINGFFGSVEIINDYLYYLGGKVDNGYDPKFVNRQLYRLDLLRNEWLKPFPLDNGRIYADTAIRNQTIYIVAGETNTYHDDINRVSIRAEKWTTYKHLQQACTSPASYNYEEKLLVIGCTDANGEILATEVFR